jgi:hypothetical protein
MTTSFAKCWCGRASRHWQSAGGWDSGGGTRGAHERQPERRHLCPSPPQLANKSNQDQLAAVAKARRRRRGASAARR